MATENAELSLGGGGQTQDGNSVSQDGQVIPQGIE